MATTRASSSAGASGRHPATRQFGASAVNLGGWTLVGEDLVTRETNEMPLKRAPARTLSGKISGVAISKTCRARGAAQPLIREPHISPKHGRKKANMSEVSPSERPPEPSGRDVSGSFGDLAFAAGGETLEPTKGRTGRRLGYGGRFTRYAASSMAPGPSPLAAERRQMTR